MAAKGDTMTMEERAAEIGLVYVKENPYRHTFWLHKEVPRVCVAVALSHSGARGWIDAAKAMHRIMSAEIATLKARIAELEESNRFLMGMKEDGL